MDLGLLTWLVARASGLASYTALCVAVLSGVALRTSVLDFLATNRALRALHDWTTWLWIPLGATHVVALVLDRTARIDPLDVVVPFQVSYGAQTLGASPLGSLPYSNVAIGLGTLSLDLIVLITLTSWLRRHMDDRLWRWIHRSAYVAFGAIFFHAVLSGTDFDSPIISAVSWSAALGIGLLSFSRMVWGRLPE